MSLYQKTERLEARITLAQKNQFQHAADLLGRSLTDFVVGFLQDYAIKVIREHEIINLSMKDQKSFMEALSNPTKPNQALLKAKKKSLANGVCKKINNYQNETTSQLK